MKQARLLLATSFAAPAADGTGLIAIGSLTGSSADLSGLTGNLENGLAATVASRSMSCGA